MWRAEKMKRDYCTKQSRAEQRIAYHSIAEWCNDNDTWLYFVSSQRLQERSQLLVSEQLWENSGRHCARRYNTIQYITMRNDSIRYDMVESSMS